MCFVRTDSVQKKVDISVRYVQVGPSFKVGAKALSGPTMMRRVIEPAEKEKNQKKIGLQRL